MEIQDTNDTHEYELKPPFSEHVDYSNIARQNDGNADDSSPTSTRSRQNGGISLSTQLGPQGQRSSSRSHAIVALPRPPSDSVQADVGPSEPNNTQSNEAELLLASLPTIYYERNRKTKLTEMREVKDEVDVKAFLTQDLDTYRLNRIHSILWMAGRPINARPLHRHIMLDMRILRTQQADMHILKVSDRLFIKPLPAYLLTYDFWLKFLCPDKPEEDDRKLHRRACGMLLSYVWLIQSDLDLKIARDEHLVPAGISWKWWKAFIENLIQPGHLDPNTLHQVDKRYQYGELRLSRINTIYRIRFFSSHFIRGYLYGYNRYVVFFKRNFGWMLVIFVYFSLVLSAMQVGVSVAPLQDSFAFQQASYGFVVFSIVLVAAIVGIVGLLFMFIFLINTCLSVSHSLKQNRARTERAKSQRGLKQA